MTKTVLHVHVPDYKGVESEVLALFKKVKCEDKFALNTDVFVVEIHND
jgi:hypothetical protein